MPSPRLGSMELLPELSLRSYEDRDADAVRRLHAAAFRALAAGHHSPAQIAAHEALIMAPAYADDLAQSHLLLAVHPELGLAATAGWLAMPDRADTARIRKVFVHPGMARRGLASAMVRAAEQRARAAGLAKLFVRANVNAVPLYEKLGYRAVGTGLMPAAAETLPVVFMEKSAAL
ncbi:MAG TPA: GNAT family N-acetyltransferase [Alphaproteobacteria bacterium]|nr:GNAT family N-acetyltransferase [Alphaproteobacteria bacterium]